MRWRPRRRERDATLRVGLLGADGEAGVFGLAARAAGLQVTAVASSDPALAGARAREVGGFATTLVDLVERAADLADAIVLTVPVDARATMAARLATDGLTVVVPPPLCSSPAEADALLAAVRGVHGTVRYGEHLLCAPAVQELLRRVGDIGQPTYVEVRAIDGQGAHSADQPATSALAALGPRAIALAFAVLDRAGLERPTSVRAEVPAGGRGSTPVTAWTFEATGPDATVTAVRVHVERDAPSGPVWDVQVAGTTGVVRAELIPRPGAEVNGEEVPCADAAGRRGDGARGRDTVALLGYVALFRRLAQERSGDPDPSLGADFGAEVLGAVCAAAMSAARGGEAVALPFDGPRWLTPDALLRGG